MFTMPKGFVENAAKVLSDVKKEIERDNQRFRFALTSGMRKVTRQATLDMRGQVAGAFGKRLANTWRNTTYPIGRNSFGPTGFIYSKAPHIIKSFEEGTTIRAREKKFLAIPTQFAKRKVGKKRLTPEVWEKSGFPPLRFVPRPGNKGLLVVDGSVSPSGKSFRAGKPFKKGGEASFIAFILVPAVRMKKRLNSLAIVQKYYNNYINVVDGILDGNR